MSLDLEYFKNLWEGEWEVENRATGQIIRIENGETYTGTFPLSTTGTTFKFQGTDPRQTPWSSLHRMFSLVTKEDDKQLVISWEDDSGIPDEVVPFSGDVSKVRLTLDKQMSGVLGLIIDDGKIEDMVWETYYDKCPAPNVAA